MCISPCQDAMARRMRVKKTIIAAVLGSLVTLSAAQAARPGGPPTTTRGGAAAGGGGSASSKPKPRRELTPPPWAGDLGGLLYKVLAYTLIILVLGAVALVVVKKVLPRIGPPGGKSISVLETVYLGPKKTLHLLQVGSKKFLVAGSREQITLLGEVTAALAGGDESEKPPAGKSDFDSVLNSQRASTPQADAP